MKSVFIILCVVMMYMTAYAGGSLIDAKAPLFSIPDQHDRLVSLRQMEGQVIVLIASDKEGTAQNAAWRKAITARYGKRVLIQGVADMRKVPFFLKSRYRKDFQKDPDSIILDWKGTVFSSYGLAPGVSNIVAIDKEHRVRYQHAGPADQDAVERLFQVLNKSLE